METTIRYAKSGDVNIAYQVTGEGPRDLVLVSGFVSHLDDDWKHPSSDRTEAAREESLCTWAPGSRRQDLPATFWCRRRPETSSRDRGSNPRSAAKSSSRASASGGSTLPCHDR